MAGFIYVWYDRKHKRFYIGSHWGESDDGYICSSQWMRRAYQRRPTDFKRRIVSTVSTNQKDLLIEEQRWLDMIPNDQLGKRYYNLKKHAGFYWWASDENQQKPIRQRMSEASKRLWENPEFRERNLPKIPRGKRKGITHSEETRAKIRAARAKQIFTEEQNTKRIEAIREFHRNRPKKPPKEKKPRKGKKTWVVEKDGEKIEIQNLKAWCIENNLQYATVHYRLKKNLSLNSLKEFWFDKAKKMFNEGMSRWSIACALNVPPTTLYRAFRGTR